MTKNGFGVEQNADLPPCPCCDHSDWLPRWKGFVVCSRCGLMTVNQGVPAEELKKYYQED